jgi:two-component system response regulator HydG
VPPLRRRRDDVPRLVERFLTRAAERTGRAVRGISVAALERLVDAPWPGNVRELQNAVGRLVVACPEGELIDSELVAATLPPPDPRPDPVPPASDTAPLTDRLDLAERRWIEQALDETGGNRTRAAERLGIHRNSLAVKMKRLGITPTATSD